MFLDKLKLKGNRFTVMEVFDPQTDRFNRFILGESHSATCQCGEFLVNIHSAGYVCVQVDNLMIHTVTPKGPCVILFPLCAFNVAC